MVLGVDAAVARGIGFNATSTPSVVGEGGSTLVARVAATTLSDAPAASATLIERWPRGRARVERHHGQRTWSVEAAQRHPPACPVMGCAAVTSWVVIIGILSGAVYFATAELVLRIFKVDDVLNAFAVHAVGGPGPSSPPRSSPRPATTPTVRRLLRLVELLGAAVGALGSSAGRSSGPPHLRALRPPACSASRPPTRSPAWTPCTTEVGVRRRRDGGAAVEYPPQYTAFSRVAQERRRRRSRCRTPTAASRGRRRDRLVDTPPSAHDRGAIIRRGRNEVQKNRAIPLISRL